MSEFFRRFFRYLSGDWLPEAEAVPLLVSTGLVPVKVTLTQENYDWIVVQAQDDGETVTDTVNRACKFYAYVHQMERGRTLQWEGRPEAGRRRIRQLRILK